ncbi:hypothetical protein [Listeria ilorinensis]|uniref:hypothetical protein n=1 Tax=Listeria ilorinensis TaxID=2867439 RepID=UPI001EF4263B|nr:hypothetical protein [Listeria ilorinensis]
MIRKLDLKEIHKQLLANMKAAGLNASFSLAEEIDEETGEVTNPINWPACLLEFAEAMPDDTKTSMGIDRSLIVHLIDDNQTNVRIYDELEKLYEVMAGGLEIPGFSLAIVEGQQIGPEREDESKFLRMDIYYTLKVQQIQITEV